MSTSIQDLKDLALAKQELATLTAIKDNTKKCDAAFAITNKYKSIDKFTPELMSKFYVYFKIAKGAPAPIKPSSLSSSSPLMAMAALSLAKFKDLGSVIVGKTAEAEAKEKTYLGYITALTTQFWQDIWVDLLSTRDDSDPSKAEYMRLNQTSLSDDEKEKFIDGLKANAQNHEDLKDLARKKYAALTMDNLNIKIKTLEEKCKETSETKSLQELIELVRTKLQDDPTQLSTFNAEIQTLQDKVAPTSTEKDRRLLFNKKSKPVQGSLLASASTAAPTTPASAVSAAVIGDTPTGQPPSKPNF